MRFYILKTGFIQSCSRMCVSKINNVKLVYEKVILKQDCKALHPNVKRSRNCGSAFHHLLFFTLILGPFLPEFLGS